MSTIKGGFVGLAAYVFLVVLVSLSRTIEDSFVGRLIWESLVPISLVEKLTAALFGAHTDERGLVVILAVVGSEFALVGAAIGCVINLARKT